MHELKGKLDELKNEPFLAWVIVNPNPSKLRWHDILTLEMSEGWAYTDRLTSADIGAVWVIQRAIKLLSPDFWGIASLPSLEASNAIIAPTHSPYQIRDLSLHILTRTGLVFEGLAQQQAVDVSNDDEMQNHRACHYVYCFNPVGALFVPQLAEKAE